MILWHPTATRKLYRARGKPWKGGSGNPKFLFHTTETLGLPNYSAPPHMTLHPGRELWQHIPFDMAAYSVRSSRVDEMQFCYQVEVIGRAREVPMYKDDPWYLEVADLIDWFRDNLGVPIVFEDFTTMKYGQFAAQRRNYATVDSFSGILGHGHVGRGIDSHWDPGRLDVPRLEAMIPNPEEDEMDYRKMLNLWGPEGLEKLRVAGRWSGITAYYFDGRSDAEEGANQNIVEHIMVNDATLSVDESGEGTPHPHAPESHTHPSHEPKQHDHPFTGLTGSN